MLAARLFYWQIIKADSLVGLASRQYRMETTLYAKRGQIFSADGFPLVLNNDAYLLYWQQENPEQVFESDSKKLDKLAELTAGSKLKEATEEADKKEIIQAEKDKYDLLRQDRFVYRELVHRLDVEQKQKIEELDIPGLGFSRESIRYYPEASMAAYLLGFVGKDEEGADTGYFGLEGYYNNLLKGKSGFYKREKDAFFQPILTGLNLVAEKKDGMDLKLTIDRSIQFLSENELKKALKTYGAKSGTVLVMNPKNGEILAMASQPGYEPDHYWEYSSGDFKNPAVADTYEPGSTFKVLTMSAGIDTGAVKADTKCDICEGPYQLDKYTINTWNNKYFPDSTMTDVIVHSDNVGMVFVSQKIKDGDFVKYLNSFGFGQKTGLDLQEEISAPLRREWSYVDLATASFGQGIAVTPIQMLRAVAAIANGGILPNPHLLLTYQNTDEKRVLSWDTCTTIKEMMVKAIEEGESKWIKPQGIKVAGKTGTSQIPIAGHYDKDKTIASFIGFAPADDPQFIILTILTEPSSSIWGSETAAPLFFNVLKRIMVYKGFGASGR